MHGAALKGQSMRSRQPSWADSPKVGTPHSLPRGAESEGDPGTTPTNGVAALTPRVEADRRRPSPGVISSRMPSDLPVVPLGPSTRSPNSPGAVQMGWESISSQLFLS